MDALTLLRDQASFAERLVSQVFSTVTVEQAIWRPDGSTANQIAALFLHVYTAEDRGLHRAQDKPTIFESGGWSNRLRYDLQAPWSPIDRPDLAAYRP